MKTIQPDLKRSLRSKAKLIDPLARIGKNGVTDNMVLHIKKMLKKRQLVKVKLLKSFVDTNDTSKVADQLAEKTGSILIEQIGFNIVLYLPRAGSKEKKGEHRHGI